MNALIDFRVLEFLCSLKYRKSEHLLVITMHSGTTRETVSGVREAYIAESGIEPSLEKSMTPSSTAARRLFHIAERSNPILQCQSLMPHHDYVCVQGQARDLHFLQYKERPR